MSPPEYYLPAENEEAFHDMMSAWRRLDRSELPCTVHPLKPGDRVQLAKTRWVNVFRAVHRVPTIGYALGRTVRKLKPEYIGLPGKEIGARIQAGEDLHDVVDVNDLAFCGDTTIDVVKREAIVRTARVLILEVTFLDDRISPERARRQGHIHLEDVVANAELFENEAILFTHFSRRYSTRQIREILQDRLPPTLLERCQPLPLGPPWET